jgi:hypothetical protein
MDWDSFISSRCRRLNSMHINRRGCYILYWMQQSRRATCNHALEHAVYEAKKVKPNMPGDLDFLSQMRFVVPLF